MLLMADELGRKLSHPLPGESAHRILAPDFRPFPQWDEILSSNPRWSAVMLLLYPKQGVTHLCLTKRASYEGVHSNQVSFPGGKVEPADENLAATALRETEEEVGIQAHRIKILGELSKIYIPPSHFVVQPFVGILDFEPVFSLQEREATELISLPLNEFLLQQPEKRWVNVRGNQVQVPSFLTGGHVCWGATAIILSEFRVLLSQQ